MESNDQDDINVKSITGISIQSETSIFTAATSKLEELLRRPRKEDIIQRTPKVPPEEQKLQENLKKQVETGEITPFEALEKQQAQRKTTGFFSNKPQFGDLEKYLSQQAELTRQKKRKIAQNEKWAESEKKAKLTFSKDEEKNRKIPFKQKKPKKSIIEINETNEHVHEIASNSEFSVSCEAKNKHAKRNNGSDDEYVPSEGELISDEEDEKGSSKKKKSATCTTKVVKKILDDGDVDIYEQRVEESGLKKCSAFHSVDSLFKVPLCIWKKLYKYQKVSVRWLWELHSRNLGGLLGDEMGLGKTVQVIAFLAGLDCSELLSDGSRFRGLGPTLIICPATLLEQWVSHLHEWWPQFRVLLLHQSSTFQGSSQELIESLRYGGILITSYSGVLINQDVLFKLQWHYVILDEGHKIRNPDAKVSQAVKKFSTPHRLLLTGSPMQNSLKELWSLFDFILPGKLGTLSAFMEHCAIPITRGGYTNATPLQEATALQIATMLKNAIMPYMLRRTKNDVQHHVNLPEKNEQVLFCSLTEEQKNIYKKFLRSEEVSFLVHEKNETNKYRSRLLVALTALRKICNHPDLYLYSKNDIDSDEETALEVDMDSFGDWKKSGKLTVVRSLLKIWKKQGHRVLLFSQSRQMLNILETFILKKGYEFLKMDGTTPMTQRQEMIMKFNNDKSYFLFLLTTRVGGLGVNLTGADRVIIYDPDWNPATDAQARERAWRIGQDKNVTIYRLITVGTIEEKIYHRQIFKVLLSNRVLEDPRQRRLFRTSDLTELFNLNEPISGDTSESDKLFRESKLNPLQPTFSCDKIAAMKQLASSISKTISDSGKKRKIKENKSNIKPKESKEGDEKTATVKSKEGQSKEVEEKNTEVEEKNTEVEEKNTEVENKNQKNPEDENLICDNDDKSSVLNSEVDACSDLSGIEKDELKISEEDNSNLKIPKNKEKKSTNDKKKKKNDISALFEGERISCLYGKRLGSSQEDAPIQTADDEYVLTKLFSKAAVNSAFQHETVLSSVKSYDRRTPMEKLAQETAQEKMECIRKSRKWCWMPSWDKMPDEDLS